MAQWRALLQPGGVVLLSIPAVGRSYCPETSVDLVVRRAASTDTCYCLYSAVSLQPFGAANGWLVLSTSLHVLHTTVLPQWAAHWHAV